MLETLGTIVFLVIASFLWLWSEASGIEVEKEHRRYWLKMLALVAVVVGISFWFILRFWAP
jgi:hypothetical protein